jgi:hypothetical protein
MTQSELKQRRAEITREVAEIEAFWLSQREPMSSEDAAWVGELRKALAGVERRIRLSELTTEIEQPTQGPVTCLVPEHARRATADFGVESL